MTTLTTAPTTSTSVTSTNDVPAVCSTDLLDLVARSHDTLVEACTVSTSSQRYVAAHLAALRAAAGLLAWKAPRSLSSKPRSAWVTLAQHAPELGEWAAFFTESGRRSRAVSAGILVPAAREADDLVRQAETFLQIVLEYAGLPPLAPVGSRMTPVQVR